ncbi:hypothetical protein HJC99_03330 [Candidatus Saccharibacteria bacterium]|nr:hypothetical protein [Candidatus Saccharibacteria bacterium]
MLDMVRVTLFRFTLNDPSLFTDKHGNHPEYIDTLKSDSTNSKARFGVYRFYKLNPSMVNTANGYTPHITIRICSNRRNPYWLTVHWSPNKAVYGHNYYEASSGQFEEMIAATIEMLKDCGITVHPIDLKTCQKIGRLDYGRNVLLTNMSANTFIRNLIYFEKNTRYKKDGEIYEKELTGSYIAFFNKSQYLIFYNKPAEILRVLEKPEKSDTSHYRFALQLREHIRSQPLEVIRVEHRLLNQTAIKRELEPLVGHVYPFTLKEVFSRGFSEAILRKHITQVTGKGSIQTFALGELDTTIAQQMLEDACKEIGMRKLKQVWRDYAATFRISGEKAALSLILEALPKTTAERGLKRWEALMNVLTLNHALIRANSEILLDISLPYSSLKLLKPIETPVH